MLEQLSEFIFPLLNNMWRTINSNIAIAFVGGLTGALGGALGAQHIIERNKRRDDLVKEIRNTNSAIMIAVSICNSALALKKQHVQPMHEQYAKEKASFQTFTKQYEQKHEPQKVKYQFVADLKSFPAPIVPIETLKNLVFSKISTHERPLALVAILEQSIYGLRDAIAKRDILIQRFESSAISSELIPQYYFGKPLPTGDKNQEYPDLVEAIHSYSDDVIFFSARLCEDLVIHGQEFHATYLKKYRKGAPRVSDVDFKNVREKGLLPPDSQYSEWLYAFTKHETNNINSNGKILIWLRSVITRVFARLNH